MLGVMLASIRHALDHSAPRLLFCRCVLGFRLQVQVCAPNTLTRVDTAWYRIVFMRYRSVFIPRAALVHPVSGFGAALTHLLLQLSCLERFCCYALCTILSCFVICHPVSSAIAACDTVSPSQHLHSTLTACHSM